MHNNVSLLITVIVCELFTGLVDSASILIHCLMLYKKSDVLVYRRILSMLMSRVCRDM